jgi:hypothetical protein
VQQAEAASPYRHRYDKLGATFFAFIQLAAVADFVAVN